MARILGLFPASLIAAQGGMTANAFYRELRELGIAGRRSEVLSLYRIARGVVATSPQEAFRDIGQVPQLSEMSQFPTKRATGVRQNVALVYRDKTTGALKVTYHSTTSENGVTRETAMATAINAYSDHADEYGQDLIGAVHTGAYRYVPFVA